MSGYSGPVDLMLEDKPESTVQAHLSTNVHDLRKPWGGYLTTDSPALLTVTGGASGRIRLPNGREAALTCQDVQPDMGPSGLSIRIIILGDGDAPY
jgi:hypothetical protein